jgi:hypothetical protein
MVRIALNQIKSFGRRRWITCAQTKETKSFNAGTRSPVQFQTLPARQKKEKEAKK